MTFSPSTLNVKVGTTGTWINKDSTTHNVVSDSGLFESGDLTNSMGYNYTYNKAGSYIYHCSIPPSMTGTVVVSENGTSTSSSNSSGGSTVGY